MLSEVYSRNGNLVQYSEINQYNPPYYQLKEEKQLMTVWFYEENAFEKKSSIHFVGTLNKLVLEGNFFNLIKGTYAKDLRVNIILKGEMLEAIIPRLRKRQGYPLSSLLLKKVSKMEKDKNVKCIQIGKEELKLFLL